MYSSSGSSVFAIRQKMKEIITHLSFSYFAFYKCTSKTICVLLDTIHNFRAINGMSRASPTPQKFAGPSCCYYWLGSRKWCWGCFQCNHAHRKFCKKRSTGSEVERGGTRNKYREHFDPAGLLSSIDKEKYTRNIAYFSFLWCNKEKNRSEDIPRTVSYRDRIFPLMIPLMQI
jgi:hypothetical protein